MISGTERTLYHKVYKRHFVALRLGLHDKRFPELPASAAPPAYGRFRKARRVAIERKDDASIEFLGAFRLLKQIECSSWFVLLGWSGSVGSSISAGRLR